MCKLLAENLDRSELVMFDPEKEIIFSWKGGHGINVYSLDGKEIDFFNVGDFSFSCVTIQEVEKGIDNYMKEDQNDW